jgi:hypothetical protein
MKGSLQERDFILECRDIWEYNKDKFDEDIVRI